MRRSRRIRDRAEAHTLIDTEQKLIDCIASGSPRVCDALEQFVAQLLHECGSSPRSTDGLLLQWEEVDGVSAFAFGVLVMLEPQNVQPLRAELRLTADRRRFESGSVRFGIRAPEEIGYDSSAHHRMSKQILGDRACEFAWIEQFRCEAGEWIRLPPADAQ